MDNFTRAYVEATLWFTTDDTHDEFDDTTGCGPALDETYGIDDLSPELLAEVIAECADFQECNADLLAEAGTDEQNGHDFALTRNGHGAGFWDRGYGKVGDDLTAACRPYGETYWSVTAGKVCG